MRGSARLLRGHSTASNEALTRASLCPPVGWLVFRGHPADATAATYRRLADETTPRAADAEGAQSHASGALHASQAAALDRLALRYFEELRSSEEFPGYWDARREVAHGSHEPGIALY